MVKKCCVYTCPSESYSGCNISFHSFPKNEGVRQKWLSSVHINQKITKNSVVCSRHFDHCCFITSNSRRLLKAEAIPTISPVTKSIKIEDLSNTLSHQPLPHSEEKILHPATSSGTPVAGTSSIYLLKEPPRKKSPLSPSPLSPSPLSPSPLSPSPLSPSPLSPSPLSPSPGLRPNVQDVGVQTMDTKCINPIEDVLRRKVKVLSQRLKRRDEKLKNIKSLLLRLKKKCKKFEEEEQNISDIEYLYY